MKFHGWTLLAMTLACPALAAGTPAPGSIAAATIAKSALLGFKLAIEDVAAGEPAAAGLLACARAYDESPLAQVLGALLSADMSPDELAELDRFFASAVGRKYERIGQLLIYTSNGKPSPEPNPELTPAEYAELEAFSKTTAGDKYLRGRWVEKPQVQSALHEKLRAMYDAFRAKG
jgi:hypothetical protein